MLLGVFVAIAFVLTILFFPSKTILSERELSNQIGIEMQERAAEITLPESYSVMFTTSSCQGSHCFTVIDETYTYEIANGAVSTYSGSKEMRGYTSLDCTYDYDTITESELCTCFDFPETEQEISCEPHPSKRDALIDLKLLLAEVESVQLETVRYSHRPIGATKVTPSENSEDKPLENAWTHCETKHGISARYNPATESYEVECYQNGCEISAQGVTECTEVEEYCISYYSEEKSTSLCYKNDVLVSIETSEGTYTLV